MSGEGPRESYLPSEARKWKPGKSKVAELKDQEKPEGTTTETGSFLKLKENRSTKVLDMAISMNTTVGSNRATQQQAYILETGDQLYLSHQALWDLDCPENYTEAEVLCSDL